MEPQILVVEDNSLNLELVTDLLEVNGYIVRQARDADEAFRLARQVAPDLILMDVSLPGLDGLTATRRLRSDPATRHLFIVALTAHAMKGDEELARQAGCDGYLSKPIDTRAFGKEIAAFLAAAHARAHGKETADTYAN